MHVLRPKSSRAEELLDLLVDLPKSSGDRRQMPDMTPKYPKNAMHVLQCATICATMCYIDYILSPQFGTVQIAISAE